ncbi:hypothetical protein PR048_005695 [Dryococelus australis]|uniref:Uncharacterized protein n=1 Tax=Dryococelus australis TaxID=614101 RepID=A0ABQ9I8W1_9NEOP|nr:hypothetical protein PR048_005695 [Dryococelus australis]
MSISSYFGQEHAVISVDEALYSRLMEIKWSVPEYLEKLIPCLRGLHISMNFIKAIGQHMGAVELVLARKAYNMNMRAHKHTLQALWRILVATFLSYFAEADNDYHTELFTLGDDETSERIPELVSLLMQERIQKLLADFIESKSEDVNFIFWWQYIDMVAILLQFTRSQCDADKHQHPDEVASEFRKGNFVVKGSSQTFNQVDPGQTMGWINSTEKKGGRIISIAKTTSALCRWTFSCNPRSHIAASTQAMFNLRLGNTYLHNEAIESRQKCEMINKGKKTILKTDRNVSHRLITAYEAVPLSHMEMNCTLCTGNKSILADLITERISCPETIQLHEISSCLVTDGQALVVALGKPENALIFGNLADMYIMTVLKVCYRYQRIDVVFDRYREETIKSTTRKRCIKSTRPIRRLIEDRDVPLPKTRNKYLPVAENKAHLANFLSNELCVHKHQRTRKLWSQEGSGTNSRIRDSCCMLCRASLGQWLSHHGPQMFTCFWFPTYNHAHCDHLWMMPGTSKRRHNIPINAVFQNLPNDRRAGHIGFLETGPEKLDVVSTDRKFWLARCDRTSWALFIIRASSKDDPEMIFLGVGLGLVRTKDLVYTVKRYTALLARRSDEALGVRVSVARIAPSLIDIGRAAT